MAIAFYDNYDFRVSHESHMHHARDLRIVGHVCSCILGAEFHAVAIESSSFKRHEESFFSELEMEKPERANKLTKLQNTLVILRR